MRILISDSIRVWGGAQRFIVELADGLAKRGHDVAIQTFPRSPLSTRARELGITVHEVGTRSDAAPWVVLPLAARMRRRPYDVVVTTWDKDLRTTGLAAKLAARGTVVVHTRECDDPLKDTWRHRWFYTRIADHIVVNSRATLKTTLESAPLLSENRTSILYKGIDLGDYESLDPGLWGDRLNPEGSRVVIGYAGQLIERKRIDVLMRMLSGPEFETLPWHLAIAGKGPQEEALRADAKRLGVEDRVTFCGFVDDIHRWLVAIDIFALLSFVEGFGYVLAEAGAAGKPCVAYRASSVPEVVKDGDTALLARQGDDSGFAAHLHRLLEDDELRRQMGRVARGDVFERHGLDTMVERMERQLLDLLGR
jgi:glycosyltransferase involved in cell wall biosynthesis